MGGKPRARAAVHKPTGIAAARKMAASLRGGTLDPERGLAMARALFESHADDAWIASELGSAFEVLHDIDFLNAAPPDDPFFTAVARHLEELAARTSDPKESGWIASGLATAARILGRSWDAVAERAYRRGVELTPDRWQAHYDLGLFFKNRGRFAEGQAANQRALELGGGVDHGVLWNLGICATGARDTATALRAWRQIDLEIAEGRFGLPEGEFHMVKVRLAQHPLAERDAAVDPDGPGHEESIWIERLSPCHGIIRSALYYDDIGVDYGDVILFDGAPITHHLVGDDRVPVFPHLATLERPGYRIYPFAGTQQQQHQIAALSTELPDDSVLYVMTEQVTRMCRSCYMGEDHDHGHQERDDRHIVKGKLCAPPDVAPADLLARIDDGLGKAPGVRLFIPDLADEAGHPDRAAVERRRIAMMDADR